MVTTDEKYKIYFEYRYLIDNILQKYSPNKYNVEELYDAGIAGLFLAIDTQEDKMNIDFKTFALFHIKREINNILNN